MRFIKPLSLLVVIILCNININAQQQSIMFSSTFISEGTTINSTAYHLNDAPKEALSIKQRRMQIAGITILTFLGSAGLGLMSRGIVMHSKNDNSKFLKDFDSRGSSGDRFVTGIITTVIGASASIPLLIRSKRKPKSE